LYAANELPWTFLAMTQFASSIFGGYTFAASLFARVVVIALLIAVPTFLLGIIMPLVLGAQADDKPEFVGRAYGMNIAGSICGALITGFTLIPALSAVAQTGIRWTLIISLIAQILIAMWLFIEWSRSFVADPDTRNIVIGIVIFVASAVIIDVALFRPEWNRTIASAGASFFTPEDIKKLDKESFLATIGAPEGEDSVRFYREGLNATVTVGQDENRNVTFLKTDGKVEAAIPTNPVEAAKGADTTTHMLLGALPPALVSGGQLHGLVIGYGSGTTSGAALVDPRVVTLDIAELERAVYAADQFFAQSNGNPLAQAGRVHKLVNDGRYILGSSYSAYDFIVCQPSDPWVSGASELFTLDFWQLAKAHLKPNGVIAQWVQMYSIHPQEFLRLCATFAHVYPNSVIVHPAQGGECVMLGFNSAEPITPEKIRNSLRTESTTAKFIPSGYRLLSDVLRSATIVDPAGVKAMTTVEPPLALNTDDRNRIEFAAARGAMTQRQNIADNVQMLQKHAATPMLSR
jgi:spermidine synthase